jgi:HK97 family phage prohead protease
MTLALRPAAFRPSTLDAAARTVEAIVSTGADVQRGATVERLDLKGADLARLIGGPVLDGHRAETTRDVLGIVEAAALRTDGIWCRLRFRDTTAAAAVMSGIADGTLRGLSIGYTVQTWREAREGDRRIRIATAWEPREVSIVAIPADPGAHFRAGETPMTTETTAAPATTAGAETARQTRAEANREIRAIAATAGLTRDWADAQIDAEADPEQARRAAHHAMRARTAEAPRATARILADHADPAQIVARAGEALYARMHPDHALSDAARPWAHMRQPDLARDCLRRAGISGHMTMTDAAAVTRAHSTSDFPLILADTAMRELRRGYDAAPAGMMQVARQGTIRDFRPKRSVILGEGPALAAKPEGAEYSFGTINEAGEAYGLRTFGRAFQITREALVNDDLGAFQIAARLGAAARAAIAAMIAAKVEANPNMADGVAVFHATHKNLTTPAPATMLEGLAAARLAMRIQTGLSGGLIDVSPRFLVVPPQLETAAEQALATIAPARADDVNPFAGRLTLIVEPRLTSAARYYLFADPARADALEYALLEGQPGPVVETEADFLTDAIRMKVRLDFGCGWIDWRGAHRVGA